MIISASRRTDIPAFYSEWFINRIKAGLVMTRNPFNYNQTRQISLRPEDVDVIISHDPPFAISDADVILDDIRRKGMMSHLGNKPLSEKIKDINFDILFCGHIHSGDHNLVNKIVNVSIRNEQMEPTYNPFYYEINKK